jgi:GNAT superfamily N-acetyltransferase
MTVCIVPATPAEIPALAALLARAFARDPMVVWPMVTSDGLEARIRGQFELVDTMFAAQGWIHRTDDGSGVMALVPPDGHAAAREIDEAANDGMANLTPDRGERYARFWAWIEAVHPPEPHWLLDQVAVEPSAQGRGIGSSMVGHAIELAARSGLPLFLETGVARNVALYERLGFGLMHEADAPGGGPRVWFMRRDPDR